MPAANDPATKLAAALDQLARARRLHRQGIATARGLSPLQLDILQALVAGGPSAGAVGSLARELGVSQPTMSDAVKALERKSLVARSTQAGGRPRGLLTVTDAGVTAAAFEDPVVAIARDLPDHLREDLLAATLAIIAGLLELGVITVARNCLTCSFHRHDAGGHHCQLLEIDLAPADLRVTCPDHEPAA
ncbi:MAG: winged helix-turn-helix transcriptional regulator [Phycicoccus sp.]|nr:winged helix-turn-helix transcriptional regulator [Phycicoccus sp.]